MTTIGNMEFHDLLAGFVRIHILHHAAGAEVYGQWLIEELARHGYRISPGTLYPTMEGLAVAVRLIPRPRKAGAVWRLPAGSFGN